MITHYPDGTRFTTRMVINSEPVSFSKNFQWSISYVFKISSHLLTFTGSQVEEFEDWVFVGLKYMVEHPNYSSVIFNTLSGNVHLRLPYGDWARVFSDGAIRLSTSDRYSMDVDKSRAVLSYPPCSPGAGEIPNLTAVKLWHAAPEIPHVKLDDPQPGTDPNAASLTAPQNEEHKKHSQNTHKSKPKEELNLRTGLHHVNVSKARPKMSKRKTTPVETLDGERLEEEQDGRALENTEFLEVPATEATTEQPGEEEKIDVVLLRKSGPAMSVTNVNKPSSVKFEIQEFLKFPDGSHLLCKAVDSWDNRFAVSTKGHVFVDKSPDLENRLEKFGADMLSALSDHCQLPKSYLSGILKTTSSENFSSASKRMNSLNGPRVDSCSTVPQTRIFVVKRNMSGYEYLKKSQVDGLIKRSKSCRETMVVVDPLPNKEPRKLITMMEPVSQASAPHGSWTTSYREPVFRPKKVTSKNMKVAKAADLRWFGYVLSVAHEKRPKFFPRPRDLFLRKRQKVEALKREKEEEEARLLAEKLEQEEKALLEQLRLEEESEAEAEAEEQARQVAAAKKGQYFTQYVFL